ncbi:tyrosine-type recombinase/integrase [Paraburkholderia sediminicola]|uniref:tyrosine-type recombinase/integrase n=3 Tax=Paraburkholderia sediminicola TaxID=458836 RepID=UPI0038B93AB5
MTSSDPAVRFSTLIQQFFMDRLIEQRNVSPRTVASYRDTFRLLFSFAENDLNKPPHKLRLVDFNAELILAFLKYLETTRHNAIRSRNARLAAIRSFAHYAALQEPSALPGLQRVLAIPMKRFDRPMVGFLTREEMQCILAAPAANSWRSQRDQVMLATLYNTGARVSELTAMRVRDVVLDRSAYANLHGKGRKERTVPLWADTAKHIRRWLHQISPDPDQWLFPNRAGGQMTRSGVTDRLKLAATGASIRCPQLKTRSVTPHVVRHATAMHMLQAGVDVTLIALWLGHESAATTHMYIEADLAMKQRALNAIQAPQFKQRRFRPPKDILAFLDRL